VYGVNNQHFVTLKLEVIELKTLPIRITKPPGGITKNTNGITKKLTWRIRTSHLLEVVTFYFLYLYLCVQHWLLRTS